MALIKNAEWLNKLNFYKLWSNNYRYFSKNIENSKFWMNLVEIKMNNTKMIL